MHMMRVLSAPFVYMKQIIVKKRIVLPLFAALFVVLAVAPSLYFYRQYAALKRQVSQGAQTEDQKVYIEKAARHIVMPEGETPTVLTVTDKERLSGQAFFAHAKNGDKVIVFSAAKKAFLYDPDADRIIEVGPVIASGSGSIAEVVPTATPVPEDLRFVLYNGTTTVGFTKTYEKKLTADIPGAVVTDRDNASRQDYETSILVDLSGSDTATAEQVSSELGIAVGDLPEGETKPEGADYLLILGTDQL